MKDSKALKAAHKLKKYCKMHSSCIKNECIFADEWGHCILKAVPEDYELEALYKKIYNQTEGVEDDKH